MTEQEELEVIRLCESTPYRSSRGGRNRSGILGLGINDAPFITQINIDGKRKFHPAYTMWKEMLTRCYSARKLIHQPTYKGCEVHPYWFNFTCFYCFWNKHYKHGYQLDKDILVMNNKIYSPETCVMVPGWVNKFITEKTKISNLPMGVKITESKKQYASAIYKNEKRVYLGVYNDPISANHAWFKSKLEHLNELKPKLDVIDERLFTCLFHKLETLRVKS